MRRVVVTGLGCVSPLGNTVEAMWSAMRRAESGIDVLEEPFDIPTQIAGCVKDFDPLLAMSSKEIRRFDWFVQYAAEAGRQALIDASIEIDANLAPRFGVAVGSGIGGMTFIEKNHTELLEHSCKRVSPFFIPGMIINMASGFLSMRHGLQGPSISIVTACTSGAHNIGHAARMIMHGDADMMLAGGSEKATTPLGMSGFATLRAISTRNDDPKRASRPWDKDRDGFVMGDGAGVLVLEEYEHAKARGAKIYAELTGFGMSSDAHHVTAAEPSGRGMVQSMVSALKDARLEAGDIDYINAHGTSTPLADPIEASAIKQVFHSHLDNLAVSSTKSMTGHLLGAAGAVEAIASIMAIQDQVAPPTINLDEPDEGCDLDFIPHQARAMSMKHVLSNSFGFGGTNGSLIFSLVAE